MVQVAGEEVTLNALRVRVPSNRCVGCCCKLSEDFRTRYLELGFIHMDSFVNQMLATPGSPIGGGPTWKFPICEECDTRHRYDDSGAGGVLFITSVGLIWSFAWIVREEMDLTLAYWAAGLLTILLIGLGLYFVGKKMGKEDENSHKILIEGGVAATASIPEERRYVFKFANPDYARHFRKANSSHVVSSLTSNYMDTTEKIDAATCPECGHAFRIRGDRIRPNMSLTCKCGWQGRIA